MKCVILAGGRGTRLSEQTELRPKPMVEIGGTPILRHIMKIYSHYGINDFVICLGYKGYLIKEYFANYRLHNSDVVMDFRDHTTTYLENETVEPWKITLVDTGLETMTGGRLKRVEKYVGNETFCMTYGDGLGDIKIDKLIEYHRSHGKAATVTATQPPGRFGALDFQKGTDQINAFMEKPIGDGGWINGGFFVLEPKIFKAISGDDSIWEQEPLGALAENGQLMAFKHSGFWQPMDTLRDKHHLEDLWQNNEAPWKIW